MMTTGFPELLSRPLSPDFTHRRSPLTKQSHSLEDRESLSSSLPLALSKKDFDQLREVGRAASAQNWQETKARRGSGTLMSPRSPTTQLSPFGLGAFRPRSASLCSPKKTFLGLPKNRAASVKQRSNRHSQATDEPSTLVIDTALAKIRNQLEQLSEEDQIMEDRVNRLMSEITKLVSIQQTASRKYRRSAAALLQDPPKPYKGYKRTLSDQPCRHSLLLTDSHHNNIILSDLQETWEEVSMETSYEEEVDCVPFDLECKEFEEGPKKRDSLDSTGSTESAAESSSSGVCVVVELVVTDASGHTQTAAPTTSQTSGSSQPEDDVFLSQ